jgi:hypothetical protein
LKTPFLCLPARPDPNEHQTGEALRQFGKSINYVLAENPKFEFRNPKKPRSHKRTETLILLVCVLFSAHLKDSELRICVSCASRPSSLHGNAPWP